MINKTIKSIKSIFNKPKHVKESLRDPETLEGMEIPRYPPFLKGIPVINSAQMMFSQKKIITRIQHSLGLSDEDFETYLFPVLCRYAEFVHLLPASENHHHSGAGGLFRHGIEVAYIALVKSENMVPFNSPLNQDTPKQKKEKHRVWRISVFLAGLLHDVGKPLTDIVVQDRDGENTWHPYINSLYSWAKENNIKRYFLHWRTDRHKKHKYVNTMMLPQIVGQVTLSYIDQFGVSFSSELSEALNQEGQNNLIMDVVREADQESTAKDLRTSNPSKYENATSIPVHQYVVDAMRRLVDAGDWVVNQPGARIWSLKQGVYIVWKQAAKEIIDVLKADGIPGIPRNHYTLAEILIQMGIAQSRESQGDAHPLWMMSSDFLVMKNKDAGIEKAIFLPMLKLSNPSSLFEDMAIPEPIPGYIQGEGSPVQEVGAIKTEIVLNKPKNIKNKKEPAVKSKIVEIEALPKKESRLEQTEDATKKAEKDVKSKQMVKPKNKNKNENKEKEGVIEAKANLLSKAGLQYGFIHKLLAMQLTNQEQFLSIVKLHNNKVYLYIDDNEFNGAFTPEYIKKLADEGVIVSIENKPLLFVHFINNERHVCFHEKYNQEFVSLINNAKTELVEFEKNEEQTNSKYDEENYQWDEYIEKLKDRYISEKDIFLNEVIISSEKMREFYKEEFNDKEKMITLFEMYLSRNGETSILADNSVLLHFNSGENV